MKRKIFILFLCVLISLTGCNKKEILQKDDQKQTSAEKSNSFNWIYDSKNLEEKEIVLNDTNIKKKINTCTDYTPLSFKDNVIYGDCINSNDNSTIMETEGLFSYNITTNKLNYYKYNDKKRIWKYIIKENYIYYIELEENKDEGYNWELKKATLQFDGQKVIEKGVVKSPMDSAFFVESSLNKDIYVVLINDTNNYNETTKISKLKNDKLENIVTLEGNHEEKKGDFLKNPQNTTKIYKNKLIYTKVSYYDEEITYELNLDNKEKRKITTNNDLDNWGLFETIITDNYYLLNYIGENTKGKLVILDNNLNTTEIDCNGNKLVRLLDNETIIVSLGNYYLGFSLKDKKFIYKCSINANEYAPYFFIDNTTMILINRSNEIKYVSLD